MFLEAGSILFDTPEEIKFQIEREKISTRAKIKHVLYTHWHPDHTQGMRIFELINFVYPNEPEKEPLNVYIPRKALLDFKKACQALFFYEKMGYISIKKVEDRVPLHMGNILVRPIDFKRNDRIRFGYLIEENKTRVMYAPCSVFRVTLDSFWENLDLLLMEIGWFGKTKEVRQKLPRAHAWQDHISFEENLEIIKKIKAQKNYFCPYRWDEAPP